MKKPRGHYEHDYSNINLNQESIDIEFSTGNKCRLFLDRDTKKLRLVVDYELLREFDKDSEFNVILTNIDSFYQD